MTIALLNQFYPEQTITLTTRDPDYVTPEMKAKLRRKNRLMRAGRVEEAGALAKHIGEDMTRHSKTRLGKIGGRTDAKDMWAAVRQLTGRQQEAAAVDGVTAESLNSHYAAISTDSSYTPPLRKPASSSSTDSQYISEWRVFQLHDHLNPMATGLDGLPAIYRSVVVAKLLYASSAWSGFIGATDRQRVDAFLGRSKRCGYCPLDLPSFEELLKTYDQQLFDKIQLNQRHLLYSLLPPPSVIVSQNYDIRICAHNRQLPSHTAHWAQLVMVQHCGHLLTRVPGWDVTVLL